MEEQFTPEDSLRLIRSMIDRTRDNISQNRIYFLLWGWITFTAIVAQFVMLVVLRYERHYLSWLLTIPAAILTIWYTARTGSRQTVRTWLGESMSHLWTGMGISFFLLSFIISYGPITWGQCWPFFILMYGLGTFVSGRLLQFRPLVIGGIFNWALAGVSVFLPFEYQLLTAALAILTSYIIPGHLIKNHRHASHS